MQVEFPPPMAVFRALRPLSAPPSPFPERESLPASSLVQFVRIVTLVLGQWRAPNVAGYPIPWAGLFISSISRPLFTVPASHRPWLARPGYFRGRIYPHERHLRQAPQGPGPHRPPRQGQPRLLQFPQARGGPGRAHDLPGQARAGLEPQQLPRPGQPPRGAPGGRRGRRRLGHGLPHGCPHDERADQVPRATGG